MIPRRILFRTSRSCRWKRSLGVASGAAKNSPQVALPHSAAAFAGTRSGRPCFVRRICSSCASRLRHPVPRRVAVLRLNHSHRHRDRIAGSILLHVEPPHQSCRLTLHIVPAQTSKNEKNKKKMNKRLDCRKTQKMKKKMNPLRLFPCSCSCPQQRTTSSNYKRNSSNEKSVNNN